jgi:hypothetical protein
MSSVYSTDWDSDEEEKQPSPPAIDTFVLYQGPDVICTGHLRNMIETSKVGECRYDELMRTFANDATYPESVSQKAWRTVACRDLAKDIEIIHARCCACAEQDMPLDKEWTEWTLAIVRKAVRLQHNEVVKKVDLERGEEWPRGGRWSQRFDEIARLFAAVVPLFVDLPFGTWEAENKEDVPKILFSGCVLSSLDLETVRDLEPDNDKATVSTSASSEIQTTTTDKHSAQRSEARALGRRMIEGRLESMQWTLNSDGETGTLAESFRSLAKRYGPEHPEADLSELSSALTQSISAVFDELSTVIQDAGVGDA